MKKYIIIIAVCIAFSSAGNAQHFNKHITTARTAYQSQHLEQAHSALQQAMQELDMQIGKEVIRLLPLQVDTLKAVTANDQVTANMGFTGATILRQYGQGARNAEVSIISNSPMVAVLNNLFNMPVIPGISDPNVQTTRVQGYKARLERREGDSAGTYHYELQVPLGSALISFRVNNTTDQQILVLANTLPLAAIVKLIQ